MSSVSLENSFANRPGDLGIVLFEGFFYFDYRAYIE